MIGNRPRRTRSFPFYLVRVERNVCASGILPCSLHFVAKHKLDWFLACRLYCSKDLFPLLDGVQFGKYLIVENPDNPVSLVLAVCYGLYRSIPFGGFIAFLALNFLSGNPTINRLIRFNMQQAIFLDIALFFPGLIGALVSLVAPGSIPVSLAAVGSNAIFITLLLVLAYTTISSLLGITPNKIPLISENVENRMPTVDMFDAKGNFLPRAEREKNREDKKKRDDKNKDKKD
jgi:Chloroplast import apparatus Tic20-like